MSEETMEIVESGAQVNENEAEEVNENELNEADEAKTEKLLKFPAGRIKHIMKMDPDVNLAAQDAIFLIAKATELFVESLAIESYSYTAANKKKTVGKTDVERAIEAVDSLAFLEGALDD